MKNGHFNKSLLEEKRHYHHHDDDVVVVYGHGEPLLNCFWFGL